MSENRRRRTAAALAASTLLHVATALVVLRGVLHGGEPGRPPPAAPPVPIEIAVLEAPPAREATRAPGPVVPSRASPPTRRGTATPSSTAPVVPAAPKRPAEPARPTHPVDLSFDALAGPAKARAAAPSSPGDDLERLLLPPARIGARPPVAELRAEAERRADAIENVRAGRADPLLFDYLRDARSRLTPTAQRIAEALPLGPAETTRGWARGYLGAVTEAHRGAFAPVRPGDELFGGPRPDVLGAYDEAEHQAAAGAESRVAEVCLGVAPQHAVEVTLRHSSGNAASIAWRSIPFVPPERDMRPGLTSGRCLPATGSASAPTGSSRCPASASTSPAAA